MAQEEAGHILGAGGDGGGGRAGWCPGQEGEEAVGRGQHAGLTVRAAGRPSCCNVVLGALPDITVGLSMCVGGGCGIMNHALAMVRVR